MASGGASALFTAAGIGALVDVDPRAGDLLVARAAGGQRFKPHLVQSIENFETRTHKRLIDIIEPTAQTVDELKKLNLPSGVDITINV